MGFRSFMRWWECFTTSTLRSYSSGSPSVSAPPRTPHGRKLTVERPIASRVAGHFIEQDRGCGAARALGEHMGDGAHLRVPMRAVHAQQLAHLLDLLQPLAQAAVRHPLGYCALSPMPFRSFAHFSVSAWINCPNASGVLLLASNPAAASFALTSGRARMRAISPFSFITTSAGVFAGARMPCQSSDAKPGSPGSPTVGTSGKSAERPPPLTAMARSRPAFTNGTADAMLAKENSTCPPTRSAIAGPPPL